MSAMSSQSLRSNDCAMGKDAPHQPVDHGKMPCCTGDRTMMGMAGLAQRDGVELVLVVSLDWATVDPVVRPLRPFQVRPC
jgi:hypothetical protein